MKARFGRITKRDGEAPSHIPYEYDPHESDVTVRYHWTAAEKQTWNHPGYPEDIEVTAVMLGDMDILPDVCDDEELMAHFADAAWAALEEMRDREADHY